VRLSRLVEQVERVRRSRGKLEKIGLLAELLAEARGRYLAFLDADDVWLPEKLAVQVSRLEEAPEAAMTYGPAQLWHGWTGHPEDVARDAEQDVRIAGGRLVAPPDLLPVYLGHEDAVPSPSGVLARRSAVEAAGGFDCIELVAQRKHLN